MVYSIKCDFFHGKLTEINTDNFRINGTDATELR